MSIHPTHQLVVVLPKKKEQGEKRKKVIAEIVAVIGLCNEHGHNVTMVAHKRRVVVTAIVPKLFVLRDLVDSLERRLGGLTEEVSKPREVAKPSQDFLA